MQKGEGVTNYLTRLRLVKAKLATMGDKPDDDEMVCIALKWLYEAVGCICLSDQWMRTVARLGSIME